MAKVVVVLLAAALVVFVVGASVGRAVAGATDTMTRGWGTAGHPFDLGKSTTSSDLALTKNKSGQQLTLARHVLWSHTVGGSGSGVGSAQWLPGGGVLVCTGGEVEELNADANTDPTPAWQYTSADHPGLDASWAWEFTTGGHTYVLIADLATKSVFAVDRSASPGAAPVWTCTGAGAYTLSDPVCAEFVAKGTAGQPSVLIADDSATAPVVFEVAWADPNDLVWHYGGHPGTGDGQLMGPTDVEREGDGPSGTTLIADARADRVITVRDSDGGASGDGDAPLWAYGSGLNDAMGAGLESNGDTMIADTGNGRVIEVAPNGSQVWSSSSVGGAAAAGALGQPRLAERACGLSPSGVSADKIDGALLVCDTAAQNLALVGNTSGGNVDTKWARLTGSGTQAHVVSLRVDAKTTSKTQVFVRYTPSSNVASDECSPGTHSLRGVVSSTIKFTFVLTSSDLWLTPTLDDVVLTYTTGQARSSSSGSGGASGGSGSASGAGTGTGSGVGGSGSGSGVGAGQGTSTDLGGSGTAGSSGATSRASGADLTVPAAAQQVTAGSAAGTAAAVTGIPVNVGDLSGGARGGGGGSPPPPTSRAAAHLEIAGAAVLLACLLGAPGFAVRRRMRRLGAIDHPNELEAEWV